MNLTRRLLLSLPACVLAAGLVSASTHTFYGTVGDQLSTEVMSFKEVKYRSVIKQQYDFSCGSAALATLLKYHYEIDVTEEEAFSDMFEVGDKKKIRAKGFSLLDMKKYLARRGLRSDGYRMSLQKLAKVGVPAIVLINTGGYKHFVVIKGVEDGMVLIGDPARGMDKIPAAEFEEINHGIVFLIKDRAKVARATFNKAEEWTVRQKAPLGAADSQVGITEFSLMLPGPVNGDLF